MFAHFRFAHPFVLLFLCLVILGAALIKWLWPAKTFYRYTLTDTLATHGHASEHIHPIVFFVLNVLLLNMIALIIARPQWIDYQSTTQMNGVDIMLALDISGSMEIADDQKDGRSRITIAKDEALHFIKQREDDAIGLVLFAKDAISRCPLTLDKRMITEIIKGVNLGLLDVSETHLSTGLITAANRLKGSQATSKIIILLTDGAPSQGDLDPETAIAIAKQLGIRVYTVGIGGDRPVQVMTPMGLAYYMPVNKDLLQKIAKETGGSFFLANNAKDMRAIYEKINALEKTKYEVEHFVLYHDVFSEIVFLALLFLALELILSTFVWFCL